MKSQMGKIRPQILLGLISLGTIAVIALVLPSGAKVEVVTGCIAAIASLATRLVEKD